MYRRFLPLLALLVACQLETHTSPVKFNTSEYKIVEDIPVFPGYERMKLAEGSFGQSLRLLPLRKDNTVYLHNGRRKGNQSAQFAVVDLPIGQKDLQQCADVVMRLRARYLLSVGKQDEIRFNSTSGQLLSFADWRKGIRYRLSGNRLQSYNSGRTSSDLQSDLDAFLELVFSYCGTQSLQNELKKKSVKDMVPGDVFIHGGFPGHAMLVTDVATDGKGKKIFMLLQGYMPAQDIHIVNNPAYDESPWYEADGWDTLVTPEWEFGVGEFYGW